MAREGETVASWRASALLEPGSYVLKGRLKTKDVKAIRGDEKVGAGLRISGGDRDNKRVGTSGWAEAAYEFTVDGRRTVELVAELWSQGKGQVWFETGSLKLVKSPR